MEFQRPLFREALPRVCCGCRGQEKWGLQSQAENLHMHKATPQLSVSMSCSCGSSHSLALQIPERSHTFSVLLIWDINLITQCLGQVDKSWDTHGMVMRGSVLDSNLRCCSHPNPSGKINPSASDKEIFLTSVWDPAMKMAKDWKGRSFQSSEMYFSKKDRVLFNFSELWLIAQQTKC